MSSGIDMLFRMMLDNSDFVKNLKQSSDQIEGFKKIGNSVVGTLGKFAGAAGIAMGGVELFDIAMHSCGETQREFESVTLGAKESIKEFFTSLTTGDWSIWEDGILNAIRLGQDYIDTLKRLKQNLNIGDVHLSDVEKTMDEWKEYFTDPNISPEEKEKKYTNEYMQFAADNIRYPEKLTSVAEKNFLKLLKDKNINTSGLSTNQLRDIVFKYNDEAGSGNSTLLKYISARELLKVRLGYYEIDHDRYENALKKSNKEVAQLEKSFSGIKTAYDIKIKFEGTEDFDDLLNTTDKLIGLEDRGSKIGFDANEINSMFKGGKYVGSKKTVTPRSTPPRSTPDETQENKEYIKDLTTEAGIIAEIKRLEDEKLTASYERAKEINKELNYLRQYKKDFEEGNLGIDKMYSTITKYAEEAWKKANEPKIAEGSLTELQKQKDELVKQLNDVAKYGTREDYIKIKAQVEDVDKQITEYGVDVKPGSYADLQRQRAEIINKMNNSSDKEEYIELQAQLTLKNKQINDFGLTNKQKMIRSTVKTFNGLSRAIAGVGDVMRATGDEGKKMAKSLVYVNLAASLANATAIMVEKTKASATVWDWIAGFAAGTAAIVSAAAQLNSINKYAEGGIVPGNSTIGDRNIARVNSGEMILNTRQQRNLFNLLNGNSGFNNGVNNSVEFHIKGKDLQGVLNNYNNKINKLK